MYVFLLAERLGKTVGEIRGRRASEFLEWIAFDSYREDEREWAEQTSNKDGWTSAY